MSLLSRAWSVIKTLLIPTPAIPVTLPPSLTFAGETILITGGTSGLGLSAAILFTTLHASTVIITARTAAKGDVARRLIEAETGRTGVVAVRVLDMDSFAGVRAFVAALKQAVPRVDRVLLNAGVHNFHYERLAGGWEADLQVNVLSTALLGVLVLDWMRAGAAGGKGGAPHLVFVGSGAHIEAVDVGDGTWPGQDVLGFWNRETSFVNGRMQYGASKLLLQYVAREVAALAGGKEGR
jgi:NAD(P)-dependent dehydrogenase (short-subunit alcohol dehydrogenase family)